MFNDEEETSVNEEKPVVNEEKPVVNEKKPVVNVFEDTLLTNMEIGKKIQLGAKIFYIMMAILMVFTGIMGFASISNLDRQFESVDGVLIVSLLFFIAVTLGICYVLYLLLMGFGAIIMDVNAIKERE